MKKKQYSLITSIIVTILLAITNPDVSKHKAEIKDKTVTGIDLIDKTIMELGTAVGLPLMGFEYNNYILFSTTTINSLESGKEKCNYCVLVLVLHNKLNL